MHVKGTVKSTRDLSICFLVRNPLLNILLIIWTWIVKDRRTCLSIWKDLSRLLITCKKETVMSTP